MVLLVKAKKKSVSGEGGCNCGTFSNTDCSFWRCTAPSAHDSNSRRKHVAVLTLESASMKRTSTDPPSTAYQDDPGSPCLNTETRSVGVSSKLQLPTLRQIFMVSPRE